MTNIFEISRKRIFTHEEAETLLPLVHRLTAEASRQVKLLMNCFEALPNKKSEKALQLEQRINEIVGAWQGKLEKLGAVPKGLWLADFDNGSGYYCWKFPENAITHWHGYQDGFSGRKPLSTNPIKRKSLKDHENRNRTDQLHPG